MGSEFNFRAMGMEYTTRLVPPETIDKLGTAQGYVDHKSKLIEIEHIAESDDFYTLLHEAFHIYEWVNKVDLTHDIVNPLAAFLTHVLIDNDLVNRDHPIFKGESVEDG
jgi:hypothetical protein